MTGRRIAAAALAALLLPLAGCGGMTRAVGVLPDTLDDLGRRSDALRGVPPSGVSSPAPVPDETAPR